MLLRECIAAEVCKYLNEVDVSRSLCVCKTLNWLIKKYVRTVVDIYKSKYVEFSGLRVAKFVGEYGVLPPNLTTLYIHDIPLDYTLLPKTLTSLTLSNANDGTICDESLEYLAPSLTKLDITGNYDNVERVNLSILTNLLDLRIYDQLLGDNLPPNLTRLSIHNGIEDLTYLWKKLPVNLIMLNMVCMLGYVYMKDLPLSLEKITILNLTEDSSTLQMRSDDYFNKNIRHVNINMDDMSIIPKLHVNITSFECNNYMSDMIFPKTLTKLAVYVNSNFDIDMNFYKNLPPNLLSLSIANTGSISVYPSLLPRSLTKLQTLDSYLYLGANDDMDFPPNIVYIGALEVNEYQTDTLDFSKLTQLRTLQIDDMGVIDKTFKILLPPSLTSFTGNAERVTITDNIIEVIDDNDTVSAEFITRLPKSITSLELCCIDDISRAVFPPNLRNLSMSRMQLSIDELNKLPQTLEYYKQSYKKSVILVRGIDGNRWKICETQYILWDTSTVNIENGANLDNRVANNYEYDEIIEEYDV